MTNIHAGDLVTAVPIDECTIGHPAWHEDYDNPEMNRNRYLVTWTGYSALGRRPTVRVAGRPEHFCAGCFVKQEPSARSVGRQRSRVLLDVR